MKFRPLNLLLMAALAIPEPAASQEDPVVTTEEEGMAAAPGPELRPAEGPSPKAPSGPAGSESPGVLTRTGAVEGENSGGTVTKSQDPEQGGSAARQNHQRILRWGSGAIFGLLGLLLILRRRRAHRPRLFPFTVPRERFSAPHSGGNNAMISFASNKPRNQG